MNAMSAMNPSIHKKLLTEPGLYFFVFALLGTAYVIGGSVKQGTVEHACSSILRAVNVATGECRRLADSLESTYQPALSAIGDRIVACGGQLGASMTHICQIFNTRENTYVVVLYCIIKKSCARSVKLLLFIYISRIHNPRPDTSK